MGKGSFAKIRAAGWGIGRKAPLPKLRAFELSLCGGSRRCQYMGLLLIRIRVLGAQNGNNFNEINILSKMRSKEGPPPE